MNDVAEPGIGDVIDLVVGTPRRGYILVMKLGDTNINEPFIAFLMPSRRATVPNPVGESHYRETVSSRVKPSTDVSHQLITKVDLSFPQFTEMQHRGISDIDAVETPFVREGQDIKIEVIPIALGAGVIGVPRVPDYPLHELEILSQGARRVTMQVGKVQIRQCSCVGLAVTCRPRGRFQRLAALVPVPTLTRVGRENLNLCARPRPERHVRQPQTILAIGTLSQPTSHLENLPLVLSHGAAGSVPWSATQVLAEIAYDNLMKHGDDPIKQREQWAVFESYSCVTEAGCYMRTQAARPPIVCSTP